VTTAEIYVTAAYLVFLAIVLLYVVVFSVKVSRLEREVAALCEQPAASPGDGAEDEQKQALLV